jgi:hypothetical protein
LQQIEEVIVNSQSTSQVYEFKVAGRLEPRWSKWFDGLALSYEALADGRCVTILTGLVIDQSALHSILIKLRDLNLQLLSVNLVTDEGSDGKDINHE